LAFIVDDAERAAAWWADVYGAGPFLVFDVDMPDTTYRGSSGHRLASTIALGQLADQQIELIRPDGGLSVYTERAHSSVHHVCYWHDVDAANSYLAPSGHVVVQEGFTNGGDRFSYLEGPAGGPYVEIVDPAGGSGAMAALFEVVSTASLDWDGQDPVRRR
jgi:catechol 2,3-dioxygenase-like lactoylglutathione lyase family enzyme